MSVTTTTNKIQYTGNGAQTVFPYTFKIFKNTDLEVYVAGVKKTLTTDYTVDGVGVDAGGNVTFLSAPANAANVTIVRVLPKTQETVYPSNDKFPAKVHEAALDRAVMLIQQLSEVDARCLKLIVTSALSEPTMADPTGSGQFLRVATLSPLALDFASVTGQGAIGLPIAFGDGGLGAAYAGRDAAVLGLNLGQWKQGADIASAATVTLPNPLDGNLIKITGNTGISALSSTGIVAGTRIVLWFTGTPALTHGANFFLQGATNYTVVANDLIEFVYLGASKWQEIRRVNAAAAAGKFLKDDGTFADVAAVKESGGQVLTLGAISDGQFLKRSGTSIVGGAPVTVLARDMTVNDVVNTTTETTVFTTTVTGGTLSTDKMIRLTLRGDQLNNQGGTPTLTIRVKYGATTICTVAVAATATHSVRGAMTLEVWLAAAGATNTQVAHGRYVDIRNNGVPADGTTGAATQDQIGFHPTVAEDSTADKTLAVTFQWSAANANTSARCHSVTAELL
jgi:hypothetical protein